MMGKTLCIVEASSIACETVKTSDVDSCVFKRNSIKTTTSDSDSEAVSTTPLSEFPNTTISNLYPEILAEIFLKLGIKDLGCVARTCKSWHQIMYDKRLWRGVEAKIHLKKSGNQLVYQTLHRRGIQNVQVLSLKRSLRELTSSLPGIRSLKLSGCYNVTDWTLSSGFSMRLENLTILNLSLCKQVSDFSLGRIASMAVNLESLDLGGCCQISNRGLLLISWGLKKLARLNLRSCYLITDTGIGFLAGVVHSSHLQEPRMNDFLVKFGLVDGPNVKEPEMTVNVPSMSDSVALGVNNGNHGNYPGRRQLLPEEQQLLFLQHPMQPLSMQPHHASKKRRLDHNTSLSGLSVPVPSHHQPQPQQCAICKQDIPVQVYGSSRNGSQNNASGSTSGSSTTRSRKRPRQQYQPVPITLSSIPSTKSMSSNFNSNSSSTSTFGTGSSSNVASHLEKITPDTKFGNDNLQQLILQDCQKLSDDSLVHLTNLPRLKSINLSFCVHITDTGLKHLGNWPALHEINLRACDNVTDAGLANLSYDLGTRVSSLDVSFCDKIGNGGLNYVSQFSRLQTLCMSACAISDEGLKKVASSLGQLETLNIGQCGSITDDSLKVIGEKCQELRYIDLYGCGKITPAGLALVMKLPKLENLNLGLWHLR